MKSLHLIGCINAPEASGATNQSSYNRIMVVYDRQPNGAFPAIADLLLSYKYDGTTSSTALDHLNPNNFDRFKILADIRLMFQDNQYAALDNATASAIDYKGEFNINRFINLRGLSAKYKASAGSIGDIASGGIYVVTFSTDTDTTNNFTVDWTARLRYLD